MNDVFAALAKSRIVPVVKLEDPAKAVPLARALLRGGLPVAEITFRTATAAASIRAVAEQVPEILVGAGTVLTVAQVDAAIEAGAAFIVTPGFNPTVVDHCIAKGIPVIPGVNSPSQVEMGLERGLSILKFFPAEASGGIKMLKALNGPYPNVRFVPTGGVGPDNLAEYLKVKCVAAIGGSWMVKEDLIEAGRWDEIAAAAAAAVAIAAGAA